MVICLDLSSLSLSCPLHITIGRHTAVCEVEDQIIRIRSLRDCVAWTWERDGLLGILVLYQLWNQLMLENSSLLWFPYLYSLEENDNGTYLTRLCKQTHIQGYWTVPWRVLVASSCLEVPGTGHTMPWSRTNSPRSTIGVFRELFNFCVPQFSHPWNGGDGDDDGDTSLTGLLWRLSWYMWSLEQSLVLRWSISSRYYCHHCYVQHQHHQQK